MRIAFLGDVHGCVFHALCAIAHLEKLYGLDAVIQVGDLGAYPSVDALPDFDRAFIAANPAQGDLFRLSELPVDFPRPAVHFLSGNHDGLRWLEQLHAEGEIVPVDPPGIFRHVACGTVEILYGQTVAFLGRIDLPGSDVDLDERALQQLMLAGPGSIDILVTHDGPYGMSSWQGETQGSRRILDLIEILQPRLHVSGHYHHVNGPRRYGRTRSYALAQLVPPGRSNPCQEVEPGSLAVYDTETDNFEYIRDDWPRRIRGMGPEVLSCLEFL